MMPAPIGLAFYHGWGLNSTFWQPLASRLCDHPQTFFDAGYWGGPPCQPDFRAATHWVAIGHSMGWARALTQAPPSGWSGLVSLGGFTRFCAHQPGDAGQSRRVVDRMAKVLARTPHAVLQDFLSRCGLSALCPDEATPLQTDRLLADLLHLAELDLSPQWQQTATPTLALACLDDPIVPAALTTATFAQHPGAQLVWHSQGGHALGHDQACDCAQAIQAFLSTLDDGQRTHQP
ncbi:MAG: alpha/beta fold hydrolase [Acidobacteriota bacterium]